MTSSTPDHIRAFVALELSADMKHSLQDLAQKLRPELPGVRWVRPEGIHLTLKFLGDVEQNQLPEIEAALCRACAPHAPFTLSIGDMGCFPNHRRPRVLWVGVQDQGESLSGLQRAVERAIAPLGFSPDRRGFHPHLTLGRVKNARPSARKQAEWAALGDYTARAKVRVGHMRVDTVHLMQSELHPSGAVYTELAACPLAAPPQARHG